MAGWMFLALWMTTNSTAFEPGGFRHVRSEEPLIRAALDDGYTRSATFKTIADQVEGLPCVVYVVTSVTLPGGLFGALLHSSAGTPDMPILRIAIRGNLSRAETIATLAHELQHVVEVMTASTTRGASWMTDVFDKLDPSGRTTGIGRYETAKAIEVTARVRDELQRARR